MLEISLSFFFFLVSVYMPLTRPFLYCLIGNLEQLYQILCICHLLSTVELTTLL
jgi:hypothetical protein